MASKSVSNNTFALCIIILIVVGLFLHYELGYNLDLFQVGVPGNHHHKSHRFRNRHNPRHYYNHLSSISTHDPNIFEKHNALQAKYDTLKTHHDIEGKHSHQEQCPNCTSEDDPNKHTGGKVHSVTSV